MANNKDTGIGIALLAGAIIGALGMWTAKRTAVSPTTKDSFDEDVLVNSLEDISVLGTQADLLKVRVLGLERAKVVAMWGSKGISREEPTKFQRMADLTTEHLLNIKKHSEKVTIDERRIIDSILEDRVASGAEDASILPAPPPWEA